MKSINGIEIEKDGTVNIESQYFKDVVERIKELDNKIYVNRIILGILAILMVISYFI